MDIEDNNKKGHEIENPPVTKEKSTTEEKPIIYQIYNSLKKKQRVVFKALEKDCFRNIKNKDGILSEEYKNLMKGLVKKTLNEMFNNKKLNREKREIIRSIKDEDYIKIVEGFINKYNQDKEKNANKKLKKQETTIVEAPDKKEKTERSEENKKDGGEVLKKPVDQGIKDITQKDKKDGWITGAVKTFLERILKIKKADPKKAEIMGDIALLRLAIREAKENPETGVQEVRNLWSKICKKYSSRQEEMDEIENNL